MAVPGNRTGSRLEGSRIWRDADLQLSLCEAFFTRHQFPKHSHDYYVVGLIAEGSQTFTHRGTVYHTPPGGMIILNPDDDHTGAPASSQGFIWRAVYPTCEQMSEAADKLGQGRAGLPIFPSVRVDDPVLLRSFNELHGASRQGASALARETLLVRFLSLLITRHASRETGSQKRNREGWVVRRARRFFLENLSQNLTLGEVARHLGIDRFRLIREFNQQLGLPPHRYLDCLRVRQAQRLLASGRPLAEVALAVGFADQSHFTKRFGRQLGVTPGRYLR